VAVIEEVLCSFVNLSNDTHLQGPNEEYPEYIFSRTEHQLYQLHCTNVFYISHEKDGLIQQSYCMYPYSSTKVKREEKSCQTVQMKSAREKGFSTSPLGGTATPPLHRSNYGHGGSRSDSSSTNHEGGGAALGQTTTVGHASENGTQRHHGVHRPVNRALWEVVIFQGLLKMHHDPVKMVCVQTVLLEELVVSFLNDHRGNIHGFWNFGQGHGQDVVGVKFQILHIRVRKKLGQARIGNHAIVEVVRRAPQSFLFIVLILRRLSQSNILVGDLRRHDVHQKLVNAFTAYRCMDRRSCQAL